MDTFLPNQDAVKTEDYGHLQHEKTEKQMKGPEGQKDAGQELDFSKMNVKLQDSSTSTKEQSEYGSASLSSSGKQSQSKEGDSSEENQSDKKMEQIIESVKNGNQRSTLQDYSESRMEQERALIKYAEKFKYFDRSDDYKIDAAYKKGGFPLRDKDITKRLRSSGTEVVKMIGQKIFSGNFNLTTISFPIKCMCAKSILEVQPAIQNVFSYYLNYAASVSCPIERMKLFMTSTMAYQYQCHQFEKPLNPLLGETYQARCADGAELFMEQTCHHPPISHTLVIGPNKRYVYSSWAECQVSFSMSSITVNAAGHKKIQFHDGQVITCNAPTDKFFNTMMGTLYQQVSGKLEFHDKANDLYGFFEIGKVPKKSQEYFEGAILKNGQIVSKTFGNYCGYMDFDGVRYFDLRDINQVYHQFCTIDQKKSLPTDSTKRPDLMLLESQAIKQAQHAKDELEQQQRHERKLRQAAAARRKKGGPKIVHRY